MSRYLRNIKNEPFIKVISQYGLIFWLFFAFINSLLYLCLTQRGSIFDSVWYWGYNNPLVILSSISLFLFCSKFEFSSKYVNLLAKGTFFVYLVHTYAFDELRITKISLILFQKIGWVSIIVSSFLCTLFLYVVSSIVLFFINLAKRYIIAKYIL